MAIPQGILPRPPDVGQRIGGGLPAATSGDWISGRDLYKQPTKFKPYAKHYLAMNESPTINDSTHGMWRRIYVIEFPRIFSEEEMDTDLSKKLAKELPGIFIWALEGYQRLRNREFKFPEVNSMSIAKNKFRREVDSLMAFINSRIRKGEDQDKLFLKDTYEIYRQFCLSEGFKGFERKSELIKALRKQGYKVDNSKKDDNKVCIFEAKCKDE